MGPSALRLQATFLTAASRCRAEVTYLTWAVRRHPPGGWERVDCRQSARREWYVSGRWASLREGQVTVPPSTSQHGFLAQRVAAQSADLSTAEARVAKYLAEHPDDVAFASASELGVLTSTSDATVIRTVKALGYPGLPALKRLLRETVRGRLTPAGRLNRSLDEAGNDPAAVLSHVLDDQIGLLEEARRTLAPGDFSLAARIIAEARQTVVFGLGVLGYMAGYFALRLSRLRHPARAATASGFLAADALLD